MDYDRNSRQRTTVVDDQNDFFEIDTNAWLDPEVGCLCLCDLEFRHRSILFLEGAGWARRPDIAELQEREQLKRQEKEMREAEEARKRRVTVTLDLLGRKVSRVWSAALPTRPGKHDRV